VAEQRTSAESTQCLAAIVEGIDEGVDVSNCSYDGLEDDDNLAKVWPARGGGSNLWSLGAVDRARLRFLRPRIKFLTRNEASHN